MAGLHDYESVEELMAYAQEEYRLIRREKNVYAFAESGSAIWRVEHFIKDNFLWLEGY